MRSGSYDTAIVLVNRDAIASGVDSVHPGGG